MGFTEFFAVTGFDRNFGEAVFDMICGVFVLGW